MSAFSNLAAQAVLPLDAYKLDDLERSAQRADQRLLSCDFITANSKDEVLEQIGRAFQFPKHFGKNLDALFDCLTELKPVADAQAPGFVVILKNIPNGKAYLEQERNDLLDVFRDAGDHFHDHQLAFRVFYSVQH